MSKIISIDHGNRMMKTQQHVFHSSYMEGSSIAGGDVLKYNDKVYTLVDEILPVLNGDSVIPVSFEVSADEAREFIYALHAVFTAADNSIADEILLVRGYGMLNETLNLMVDAGELNDAGGLMLRLTTYVQYGQASVQDTAWLDLRLWWE